MQHVSTIVACRTGQGCTHVARLEKLRVNLKLLGTHEAAHLQGEGETRRWCTKGKRVTRGRKLTPAGKTNETGAKKPTNIVVGAHDASETQGMCKTASNSGSEQQVKTDHKATGPAPA